MYYILPLTEDPRQVFTLDLTIDGDPFHARVEIRYLPAPDCWVISVWDNSSGELLINQIPLICSYGQVNDLLLPFRHLRDGHTTAESPPDHSSGTSPSSEYSSIEAAEVAFSPMRDRFHLFHAEVNE